MSFVKKIVKKTVKFVKKHWKKILIAAAIVFTAGIATVGFAAFSGVSTVGGFFSAVGSTMVAGGAAIAGTVGIGSGVTATTAGGAFAGAPIMAGVQAGSGLTLINGAAAQALGLASSTKAAVAGDAFLPAAQGVGSTVAGDAVMPAMQQGAGTTVATKAASIAPESMAPHALSAEGIVSGGNPALMNPAGDQAGSGLAGWLNSPVGKLTTSITGGMLAGRAAGKDEEEDDRHRSFGGEDWLGNAAGTDISYDEYRKTHADPNSSDETAWALFNKMRQEHEGVPAMDSGRSSPSRREQDSANERRGIGRSRGLGRFAGGQYA